MKVVVSGSAGFVGSHFTSRFQERGWDVTHFDIASLSREHRLDCRDFFRECDDRFDLLVHCAAVIGSRAERDEHPLAVYENLSLDQSAIAWCLRTETPLLYFSSSAVYPTCGAGPFDEADADPDEILCPDAAYGFNKLVGERQCWDLKATGVPVHVVRPFSGYGTDQSSDYPFPAICERVRQREDPLVVWSDTERDFIHVDDVVSACLTLVEQKVFRPVNIGTGIPTRMSELARHAADVAGYSPQIEVLNQSAGPDHRFADTTLLESFYTPKITLEEGIARALA